MESDQVWQHIDTQRAEFADLLSGLTPEQWGTQSLCTEWTVRDVAAHVTKAQITLREAFVPMLRAGFDFDKLIRDTALESPAGHDELIATIRGFAGSRKRPPFVTELEPLIDIMVHTQDVCIPLGIDRQMPTDAAVTAIDRAIAINRNPMLRLRRPLRGVRLVAIDAGWSSGEGPEITGELRHLLMLVTGRDGAVLPHLTGATHLLAA